LPPHQHLRILLLCLAAITAMTRRCLAPQTR